ncbi:MAG: DUF2292 domain-containing protein [Candidatus Omnitrophica bacterium]|nr:DUF2292 domain-containing protein [Candidatus Omnitrophota bacterium]
MAKKNENSANENIFLNDSIVKEIIDAVRGVDFGIITVKVHASRIVQMEVTQKNDLTRFGTSKEVAGSKNWSKRSNSRGRFLPAKCELTFSRDRSIIAMLPLDAPYLLRAKSSKKKGEKGCCACHCRDGACSFWR